MFHTEHFLSKIVEITTKTFMGVSFQLELEALAALKNSVLELH